MTTMYKSITPRTLKLTYGFTSLLTPDGYNPKTRKGRAKGFSSAILHLAPSRLSGHNVCPWASPGCISGCLNTAGHGGIVKRGDTSNDVQRARIKRTEWFFRNRYAFLGQLLGEISTHVRRANANGMVPVVRLNGTSDIPWESVKTVTGETVLELFPEIQFYDYTKSVARVLAHARGEMPSNYHLTFSRSELNDGDVRTVLAHGGNVAAVFSKALPAVWAGYPVVNGDQDDLRFLDPAGVVVGLKAKGRAKRDASGFVVPTARQIIALPVLPAIAAQGMARPASLAYAI